MFAIPGKQAVSITAAACTQISKLMKTKGHSGLRIGIKKGGCAGWLPQDKMFEEELGYPKRTQRLCLDAADAADAAAGH